MFVVKTGGDGVKESHVRNLLHSRILDRERGGTHLFGMLKLTPSAPLYLSTVWCYKNAAIIRPRRSRSAAAYSRQTFPWTICLSVCLVHCGRTADRIWMPFGVIGRTGPEMRHIVGFWDQSTGRGTFGGEFGANHCNQWGLTFAATQPSSQITLGRLVILTL